MEYSTVVDFFKKFKKNKIYKLCFGKKRLQLTGEVKCADRQTPNKWRLMGLLFRSQGMLWNI